MQAADPCKLQTLQVFLTTILGQVMLLRLLLVLLVLLLLVLLPSSSQPPPLTRFDFSHLSRAYTSNDAAALLRQLPDLRDDFEVAADGTTVAGWGLAGEHVAAPDSSELSLEQARTFMGLAAELPQPLPTSRNREAFFRLLGRTLTGISLRSGIEPRNEQPPGGELHHAIGILAPTTGCKVTTYTYRR